MYFFRLQEARLEVLKELLKQREANHQDLNTKRLDRLWYVWHFLILHHLNKSKLKIKHLFLPDL